MNRVHFFVYALVVFHASVGRAQIDDLIKILPSNKKEAVISALSLLPAKQRQGIQDYLAVIGLESDEGQNVGFKNFNEELLYENPCINELAGNFYADLLANDLEVNLKSLMNPTKLGKPSLKDTTKETGLKPGWLWEKALSYSKGDKLLAMQLVGICGHDDLNQLDEDFRMKFSGGQKGKNLFYSDVDIKNKIAEIWKGLPAEKRSALEKKGGSDAIFNKLKKSVGFEEGITCPAPVGAMYYAKSLGEQYDIPEVLKDRIAKIQAPSKGAEFLPGKYYHLMGAAYSSCFLVRRNVPDFVSEKIVKGAINVYRSSRMCNSLTGLENPHFSGKSTSQIFEDLLKVRKSFESCFDKATSKGTGASSYSYWIKKTKSPPSHCYAADLLNLTVLMDEDITNEILQKKISRKVAEHDAVRMFRASKFYSSSNQCQGTQLGTDVKEFLEENSFTKTGDECGMGLDKQRCEGVRKLLETYLVDFEWSEAQHLAGLKFAKDHCPSMGAGKSLDAAACKALGKPVPQNKHGDDERKSSSAR